MGSEQLRYTVSIDGRAQKIMSVSLDLTGLVFDFKPAEWRRPIAGSPVTDIRTEIDLSSFHHSPESPIGNLITRKLSKIPDEERKHRQFTLAIKTTNSFAKIHARRFPDLSFGWHESQDGGHDVCLGNFDPKMFNLIICVFVGNRDRSFSIHDPFLAGGINISEQKLGEYKIITLYSFYRSPSIIQENTEFLATIHPDTITDESRWRENDRIMRGFNDHEVLEEFFYSESRFRADFFQITKGSLGARSGIGTD